jgi:predicted permease
VQALPGVESAAMTSLLPMTGRNSSGSTFIEQTTTPGLTVGAPFQKPYIEADFRAITAAFFQSMQIPLLRGRVFSAVDSADAAPVIMVDEEFARRIWPDRDPIGQRLAVNAIPNSNPPVPQWRAVVGVVGHVKNNALDQLGREQTYVPIVQTTFPIRSMYLTVRAAAEPTAVAASIQRIVRRLDPSLPVYEVKTMSEWLDATVSSRRFNMMLLVAFGALALTLAAIGTYGVIAYSVSQRTQEIGIRMALGAGRGVMMKMVLGQGMTLVGVGVVIGLAAAFGLTRLLAGLLFGVKAGDPLTFAAVAVILTAVALLAAFVPAQRATRVDPILALRQE